MFMFIFLMVIGYVFVCIYHPSYLQKMVSEVLIFLKDDPNGDPQQIIDRMQAGVRSLEILQNFELYWGFIFNAKVVLWNLTLIQIYVCIFTSHPIIHPVSLWSCGLLYVKYYICFVYVLKNMFFIFWKYVFVYRQICKLYRRIYIMCAPRLNIFSFSQ